MLERVPIPRRLELWQISDFCQVREAEGVHQINAYRNSIKKLLDDIENERPVLECIRKLKDSNQDVREKAARRLGELEDPISADALIHALADPDEDVKFEAAIALGKLQSYRAHKHLVRLLEEDDPDLCAAAAYALGKIGLEHTIGSLLHLLDHPDRFVPREYCSSFRALRYERSR